MRGEATPWAPAEGVWAMMELRRGGGGGEFGGGSHLKAAATNVDFGGTRAEADDSGNFDELRAEAFGGLDAPAAADAGSGLGLLGDDASGGNDGGVEVIAARQLQPPLEGGTLGLGGSHAAEDRVRRPHGHGWRTSC